MSLNPEQEEPEVELAGSGELREGGEETNAAEALDGAEGEPRAGSHTVHIGSVG